jgi:phosphatidyl-myo-inositol dimannoside synthase
VGDASNLLLMTHEFPRYPGGVAQYCSSMAAAAARAGFRVTVLAPNHRGRESLDYQEVRNVEVVRFEGDIFNIKHLRSLKRIVNPLLTRQSWDIAHLADWPMLLAARGIRSAVSETVASLHGSDVMVLKNSWRARLWGSHSSLRAVDRYVCNSMFTSTLLTRAFPWIPAHSVAVTPLGVDGMWFEPPAESAVTEFKRIVAFDSDDRLVLTVARLDARKGHLQTIAALSRLPDSVKVHLKYVCVGSRHDTELLRNMLALARAGNVKLYVTDSLPTALVRAAYATASVFSLTAEPMEKRVEGFGLVLLEAAAAGLPAVVTAVHAIPEVVDPVAGWICPPADTEALTRAFADALTAGRREELRNACIRHARKFTWDACARLTYRTARQPASRLS